MTFKVYYGFIGTDKPCPLKICNGHRTPEKIFLRWNNEIVVEKSNSSPPNRPKFTPKMVAPTTGICVTPFVPHRTQLIVFTSVKGCGIRRNLYTFCWIGILSRIWVWFEHSMPFYILKQVKVSRRPYRGWRVTSDGRADRFAIFHPKWVLLPLCRLRGLSKRKNVPEDFFTMEEQIQSCNGIITFDEAYRYQKS